jgi:integrase
VKLCPVAVVPPRERDTIRKRVKADRHPRGNIPRLRHTHASQPINAADIVTIRQAARHAKPDISLRIYAHLFRKEDGKTAAAINAASGLS